MLNITLKQLEIFEAAAEHCSFSEAAAELYLGQSTVSGAIAELEASLNTKLFDRTAKKKMQLTPEGHEVYLAVRNILEQCRSLEHSEDTKALKIGCSSIPSLAIVPKLIAAFSASNPDSCFEIYEGDSESVHEMLKAGKIELGFVGSALDRPAFIYEKVASDELILITPDNEKFREAKAAGRYGYELLDEPIIFREIGSGTQRRIDTYLTERNVDTEKIHVAARMTGPVAIENAVCAGLGVSIVSKLCLRPGKYISFPLDENGLHRDFYMVRRKKEKPNRLNTAFIYFVIQSVKENLS